jgi:hypothetical protein
MLAHLPSARSFAICGRPNSRATRELVGEDRTVHLLETTLRDGSYEVDFQFTAEDTAILAGGLDNAGISYIEVRHGMGVGNQLWGPSHRAKVV